MIAEEAHQWGLRVAAHAHGGDGIKAAIKSGIDTIEHASLVDDEGIKLMKEHHTWLVPTLYLGDWLIENAEAIGLYDHAKVA